MKILNNKNLTQKIIIAIVIMISFNFIAPTYSRADIGGVLLGPVIDLIAGIGDAVMALLQYFMDGGDNIQLSSSGFLVKSTDFKGHEADYGMQTETGLESATINADDLDQGWFGWGTYSIPIIKYSPEKIFANEVPALDANFINPKTDGYSAEQQKKSIAIQLQETISSWYNALRNLVIVGLLSVLLYVGIRIMITSTSSDKAKYKQMLMDWLIALCLLFFLHYIMSFTMTFIEIITDGLKGATDINITIQDSDNGDISFKTNLAGYCRMQVQYKDLGERMVYLIFYIALVVYTFMFTWKYMKRAITMAFLTLMAPLVTLTYPIDKMGDGKAQAFNMWLKEYIFNALLQPFHLIVYSIFLGASMNIAVENPLYAILFLAFITPAEKILRKFFKFDQATTAGASFAGGFGGAAAFNMVKGLVNKGANRLGQGKSGGSNGGNKGSIRTQNPVKDDNAPRGYDAFANGSNNPTQNDLIEGSSDIAGGDAGVSGSATQSELENGSWSNQQAPLSDRGETNAEYWDRFDREHGINDYENNQGQEQRAVRYENGQLWDANGNPIPENSASTQRQTGAKPERSIRRAIGGAAKGTARYTGEKLRKRFATKEGWKKNAAFLGRAAVRTVSTGVGAAVGLGMGIAGDDLEDVLKYGAAGAALGGTALNNMVLGAGRRIANSGIVQAASTGAREAYYGSVNTAAIAEQTSRLKDEGELRDYIGNNITHDDGTRLSMSELDAYEARAIEHYNAGVTDFSAIEKTLKLENDIRNDIGKNQNISEEERNYMAKRQSETIAKIAGDINGDKLATDAKYRQGRRDDFKAGLLKANPGMSQKEVKENTEQMMKLLCKYKKVNYIKD